MYRPQTDFMSSSPAHKATRTNPPLKAKSLGQKSPSATEEGYMSMQTTGYESRDTPPNFNEDKQGKSRLSSSTDESDSGTPCNTPPRDAKTERTTGEESVQKKRQEKKQTAEKLKETKDKNAQLQKELKEVDQKKIKAEEDNARLQKELKEVDQKKIEAEEDNARLQKELKEVDQKKIKAEEDNARLQKELKEVDQKKIEAEEEIARLNRASEENLHYFIYLASVLVLVPLCIGLHLAFKGPEINHHELRLMLVGKTGAGKSASGNTILGEEAFRVEASPASVTASCNNKSKVLDGRNVTIIDTPGVMDTWLISDQTADHAHECISMSSTDPHVFLLVIRLGRFTVEERNAVKWIQENFGEEALKFTMILFTGGDLLEGKPVEKFISNSYDLQNLVDTCDGRYHVFNNYEQNNRTQVKELFEKINAILHKNMGYFYTKEVHQKVQQSTREEEGRKRVILEKEIKTEEEKKRAAMEKLIREEEKMKSEQLANEVKEEAHSRETAIRQEEELKRKHMEEEMKVEERRKMNEMAMKLRDEQYENKDIKADLEHAYSTSFWFKVSTGMLILILVIVIKKRHR